jgi:hypothetical protein
MFSAHFEAPLCDHLYLLDRCSFRIPLRPVNLSAHSRWLAAVVCVAAQRVPPAGDPPQLRVPSCGAPAGAGCGGGGPRGGARSSQPERLPHREQEPHLRVQVRICVSAVVQQRLEPSWRPDSSLCDSSNWVTVLFVLLSASVYSNPS